MPCIRVYLLHETSNSVCSERFKITLNIGWKLLMCFTFVSINYSCKYHVPFRYDYCVHVLSYWFESVPYTVYAAFIHAPPHSSTNGHGKDQENITLLLV